MSKLDKNINKAEKPKDKGNKVINFLLAGATVAGLGLGAKGAGDVYEGTQLKALADSSLKENKSNIADFAVRYPNQQLPGSYMESQEIIKRHQGQAQFQQATGAINTVAGVGIAGAAQTIKKLKGSKDKKNKDDKK